MDSCSSNASSVTSFDLEAELQEVAEKPLSPVLSTSKINRRALLNRKVSKRKSRVKLASKFSEDASSRNVEYQNVSTANQMRAVDVYEEQRRRYYELLCDDSAEENYGDRQCSSESANEYSSARLSPVQQDVRNKLHDESIETMVNYHCSNQNSKTVRFRTAGGRYIDISEDSLQKGSEIFEDIVDGEALNDYSIFKNPTATKKKLSKIPIPNQPSRKNVIKTKTTRSTYEEIKINMSDIMVTQTQVDCYEDFVQNDSSNDYSISNTEDSGGTVVEETLTDSMNKIFSNKKFMEFSGSSVENVAYSDTFVEVTDVFNYNMPTALNNNPTKKTNLGKSNLENVVDEDWSDTKHIRRANEEEMKRIALARFRKPNQEGINMNLKQARRESSLSPPRKGQEVIENNNTNKGKHNEVIVQQVALQGNVPYQRIGPGEKVNIDAATSKNLVIVTMAPTNCDGNNSYRSVVELHRNTNFNQSNDSVQNCGLPAEQPAENRKKPLKENKPQDCCVGFNSEEQQQAKKALTKVTEAVERIDQNLKTEKKKIEKKTKKTKKRDPDKDSMEASKGDCIEEKMQKKEKSKHKKARKEADSLKGERQDVAERKARSRNTSTVRRSEPTHDSEIGDGVIKEEEIKTITYDHLSIVAEKCKQVSNHKKRKGPTEILPSNCSEITEKDNENQTIELSPNQKKFKIEIDCNSKFRINISCNGDQDRAAKAIEALSTNYKTGNIDHSKDDTLTELNTQICLDKVDYSSDYDLQQPKGKLVKKFINKAQKLYRERLNSDINLAEKKNRDMDQVIQNKNNDNEQFKIPQTPNKDVKFYNRVIKVIKQNDSSNGSEPNYEEFSEPARDFIEFSGFKSAGGKDVKFSEKALKKAKKMYEDTYENRDIAEEIQKEPAMSLGFKTARGKGVKASEKAINRAKKMYEDTDSCVAQISEKEPAMSLGFKTAGGKDVKDSEQAVSRAKKMYEDIDTYVEEMDDKEPPINLGFKTAGGRDVKVSEKAVNRAKKMYENIDSCVEETGEKEPTMDLGFKTAGGKDVKVSEKAVSRAKKIYDDIDSCVEEMGETEPVMNLGFKAARVKDVKASEKAINRTKKMYEDVDSCVEEMDETEPAMSLGFKTARGKDVNASERTINRTKKIYDDIDSCVEEMGETEQAMSLGFKTARGKDVKISEKAINRAKKMYEDIDSCVEEMGETEPAMSVGFKTARGKDVKASENAINRAKRMYEDIDSCVEEVGKIEPAISLGFKTAGGKDVKISEKAVSRAKKIYENIDSCIEGMGEDDRNHPNLRRDIKISEKTLNKAKQLFEVLAAEQVNIAEVCQADVGVTKEQKVDKVLNRMKQLYDSLNNEHTTNENGGGKGDNIQDFVAKAGTQVDKDEKIQQLSQTVNNNMKSRFDLRNCGFASASGNSVVISEKAMNRAKKIFEGIAKEGEECPPGSVVEEPTKDRKKLKPKTHCLSGGKENNLWDNFNSEIGFVTGSGEKVKLTSKGLEQAKAMFGDLSLQAGDFDPSYHDKKHDNALYDTESLTAAQIYHQAAETPNFCMGDYIPSSENMAFDKTLPTEEGETKTSPIKIQSATKNVNTKTSKKAFELLEDVVETVDHALQSIDEKLRRPKASVSRKRLGMSRFKQINIPNETLERARLLFKEDLDSTVVNIRGIARPVKISQPACSTPILKQPPSVPTNSCASPKVHFVQRTVTADSLTSSVLICERTKGTIEDWFSLINSKVEFIREQLKDLEEKKAYLIYQKEVLERNKSEVISPQPGILIRRKEHIKLHLKDLKTNTHYIDDISEFILSVTLQNAENVHFTFDGIPRSGGDCMNLYTTLDGALVIPNMHNIIGYTEIRLAFRAMPGVDAKLVPNGWFENHYKLIVWKLASYERFLSAHLKGCLTVENVVQQLKYRYDREIDRAQRSALRKIVEKDDIPQKRIVWCVSALSETNKTEIELTDGWYCLKALIDEGLATQVSKNKLKVGTKLVTAGAQILNCNGCHPLEASSNIKLKICYNSTRRAPWYAKLGYQKCAKPLLIPLDSIRPDGGMIGCIKIYVARMYPLRFMEQIDETKIWRNSKAEEKRAREFENERLSKMEKVHYEVQKKYEQERMLEKKNDLIECSKMGKSDLLNINCPKTLLSLLECSNDPDALMEYLSSSQRANVLEYRQTVCLQRQHEVSKKISEEMEKLKLAKRKVVSILKLLVLDATSQSERAHQFCLWNPSEDNLTLLKEYNIYYAYNILPRFNGELFSTSKTFFKLDKKISHNKFKRQAYPIAMLLDSHYRPSFSEFDTVGIAVYVNVMETEQNIWLADYLGNLLFVKVRDGPKFCRLLDEVNRGDVISIQNLLYCPPQADFGMAVANQFTIVTKSMQNCLRECMEMFKLQLPKDLTKFLGECTVKIERNSAKTDTQSRGASDVPFLQCGLKLATNPKASSDDSSEDSSAIPQKLTATDIAMSLIDTDQFV